MASRAAHGLGVEADAVVRDAQDGSAAPAVEGDVHPLGLRMPQGVVQGLLGDPQHGLLLGGGQRTGAAAGEGDAGAVGTVQDVDLGAQGGGQTVLVEPGGIVFRDLEMLKGIGRPAHDVEVTLPVIANSQDMKVLGDRLEAARDPHMPAVVVAGHGLYVWGATPRQARHHTEVVEWLLELELTQR